MNTDQIAQHAKAWINPPNPGRGKNLIVGGLIGLLAGPIGAGIYLRSLTQLCYALSVSALLMLLTGGNPALVGTLTGAAWAIGRILYDTPRTPPAAPTTPITAPDEGMVGLT